MNKTQTLQSTAKEEKDYSELTSEIRKLIDRNLFGKWVKLIQKNKVCKKQIKVKKALLKSLRRFAYKYNISLN